MDDQIEGMVERAHGHHDTDGFALGKSDPSHRPCIDAHGDHVTCFGAQHFGAIDNAVNRTHYLDARIDQWLAAFPCSFCGQVFGLFLHETRRVAQDFDTSCGRKPRVSISE